MDYCQCPVPAMDVQFDDACRRCGLPVDFVECIIRVDVPEAFRKSAGERLMRSMRDGLGPS